MNQNRNLNLDERPDACEQHGSALIIVLFVLVLLTVLGLGLLFVAHSDVSANQADLRSKNAFYIAEAGIEDARETLRANNAVSSNPNSLSDELTVAAGANAAINFDANSLKPVYDSSGNVTSFTGGGDDVAVRGLTSHNGGWYGAYVTNDPVDGKTVLTDSNNRLMITAIGADKKNSVEIAQAIVERTKLPAIPSTITMLGPSPAFDGGSSAAKLLSGDDCSGAAGFTGVPGLWTPVVGTIGTAAEASAEAGVKKPGTIVTHGGTVTGVDAVSDVSSTIDPKWTDCATLVQMSADVRAAADYVCTPTSPCSHWGTSTISTVTWVYGDITVPTGKGVLWVTGKLTMSGGSDWDGPIYVVGEGFFQGNGGGSGHTYGGLVIANIAGPDSILGTADDCTALPSGFGPATYDINGGGTHDTIFCQDAINQSLSGFPLKVVAFRQK